MITFTQSELYDAVQQYVRNHDSLLSAAKAAVVEWKYADEEMFGLFPLFNEIGFRGDNQWEPAKRAWLASRPTGDCYEHGTDAEGRVQLIQYGASSTLIVYFDHMVDEMYFRGREAAPHALKRHLLENGQVIAIYEYCLDPHQYTLETYQYGDNKLVKSIEKSWFINDGNWVEASWTTTCVYEYDSVGLIRVFLDMGERLGGISLVYVRPKSGRLHTDKKSRRPFVAYTIDVSENSDNPEHQFQQIYSDAYGLEMNIDDEWPVDTVLLVPPSLVAVVTNATDVTSMGTVYAGAKSIPSDGDLRKIKDAGGTWLLLDADDSNVAANVRAALDVELNVILSVTKLSDISNALVNCHDLIDDRLVIAIRLDGDCAPDVAQTFASNIRTELTSHNCANCRVILASRIGKDTIINFMTKPDIDGVLHFDGDFCSALDVLVPIALNS